MVGRRRLSFDQVPNFIIAHNMAISTAITKIAVSASEPLRDRERPTFDWIRDLAIRDAAETAIASSL
ncbi:MAG: hypothetical protein DIU63_04825 [Proteobacteria bacterium]|jgi:hypothetical protein|nr:MAG: hypothetical protein DIU63_04825 [Pseudomonadota bacterium]